MPLELQAKLLRVLQERQVERVGSHQTIALDVRVIAATNQDLIKRVSQGLFREDLYYRINVFPLKIPALRERCADILPLAERFLLKYRASMGQPEARLSETTRRLLGQYPWPGNVRELENAIQRGLLLCDGHWIEPQDMALDHHALATDAIHDSKTPAARSMTATASHAEPERTAIQERRLTSAAVTEDASATATASAIELPLPTTASGRSTMQPLGTDVDESGAATGGIRALEREHILKVLHQVGGSRKRAVEILGISERTLRYKLKLWRESGIQVP